MFWSGHSAANQQRRLATSTVIRLTIVEPYGNQAVVCRHCRKFDIFGIQGFGSAMEWICKITFFSTIIFDTLPEGNVNDWFSAQENCRNQGKQLTTNLSASVDDYWTGKHKRYSQMMNILGCFEDENFIYNTLQIFDMKEDASIGLCQEYCMNMNSTIYAVKNNECRCLQNPITAASLSAGNCNYRCTNEEDDILSNECGGNGTFNVFSTMEVVKFDDEKQCVAHACEDETLKARDCTDKLKMLCNSTVITPSKKKWKDSLNECKSSYGLYTIGHRNSSNLNLRCQTAESETLWIGVVREKYVSKDTGHKIHDKKLYFRCQKCKKDDCAYEKCSKVIKSDIICSSVKTSEQVRKKAVCVTQAAVDKETQQSAEKDEFISKQCQYLGKQSSSRSIGSETNEENAVPIYTVSDENCYDKSDWKIVRKEETPGNIYDHAPGKDKSEESFYDSTTDTRMKDVLVEDTYDKVLQT
ncbi:uncharacterized protein LOC134233232 [Saccostrea cucullata]|uniref:uncharacterized protein LOC134233232 n=1 Tax=Saccostrea cuccullata TaxID=36930 RepID=UPI002ED15DF3